MTDNLQRHLVPALQRLAERLRPNPKLTPSEFADRYRRISSLGGPEAGQWRTSRAPYLRFIMDLFDPDNPAEWIILRFCTQSGKTEALINAVLYYMRQYPRPMVFVQPTEQAAADFSEQRIADAIRSSPEIRKLVTDQHSKDETGRKGKDSVFTKSFPGGSLFIGPATKTFLASKPAGVVVIDELHNMPRELPGEGSPLSIVEHRTQNFLDRKLGAASTAADEDDCPITDLYERTNKCVYEVPCLECGTYQPLNFRKVPGVLGGMVWPDGAPHEAKYECSSCGHHIPQSDRPAMLAAGRWTATAVAKLPNSVGCTLSALYSPWVSWGKLAAKFCEALHDPVIMRDFVTLDLAEPWTHKSGEVLDAHELDSRREPGFGAGEPVEVPGWVQVLTSFADVQQDRIELSVWGWSASNAGCLIGHWLLYGDPTVEGHAVWGELAALLLRKFRTPRGMLEITAGGIDSGWGSSANVIYSFVMRGGWQRRRQFATKGLSSRTGINDQRPIWPQQVARKKGSAAVHLINTGVAKLHIHMRLAKPGMLMFPAKTTPELPADYFEQLTAEELVRKSNAQGHRVRTWALRKGQDRNEALDCVVGCYAAFVGLRKSTIPLPCGERADLEPCMAYSEPAAAMPQQAAPKAAPAPSRKSAPSRASAVGASLWQRLGRF